MDSLIPERYRVLSGFALKRIAVLSMVIDHFGSIVMDGVLAPYMNNGAVYFTPDMPFFIYHSMYIKEICQALGSAAFPIFCFLIVEGFIHTHSRLRYGVLMAIFAIISELPYDLAHYGVLMDFSLQNVMFTLCVGILTLFAVSRLETLPRKGLRTVLIAAVILAGAGLAFAIRSEYVFLGIFTIALFYLLRNTRWQIAGLAPLLIVSPWILLAAPALLLYSGARGKGSKYFFYVFYPTHFLLFFAAARLLAGRAVG